MSKKANFEKAELVVARKNILRELSAFEYEYNPPSAFESEQRYARYGIKLPFKIYYQYKMPFGLESSYDLLFWLRFGDKRFKLPADEEEWAELNRINVNDVREQDKKLMEFYRTIPYEQFRALVDWAKQLSPDDMIAEIKRLNPELAHIKTDGKTSMITNPLTDFIQGVAYGFAPEDIELCLTTGYDELQKIAGNPRYQNLRFGHITTPESYEALLVAEQQIQQIEQSKQNNGKE